MLTFCVKFDYGERELEHRMKESQFPWLASNISERVDGDTNTLLRGAVREHVVAIDWPDAERDPLRVGFFGVCTTGKTL